MPIVNSKLYERLIANEDYEGIKKEMERLGWSKELTFDWVDYDPANNVFKIVTYFAEADKLVCNCEAGSSALYIRLMPSGLVSTCCNCRKTDGILNRDLFEVIDSRIATIKECLEVMKVTNQIPPSGIKDYLDKSRKKNRAKVWI